MEALAAAGLDERLVLVLGAGAFCSSTGGGGSTTAGGSASGTSGTSGAGGAGALAGGALVDAAAAEGAADGGHFAGLGATGVVGVNGTADVERLRARVFFGYEMLLSTSSSSNFLRLIERDELRRCAVSLSMDTLLARFLAEVGRFPPAAGVVLAVAVVDRFSSMAPDATAASSALADGGASFDLLTLALIDIQCDIIIRRSLT